MKIIKIIYILILILFFGCKQTQQKGSVEIINSIRSNEISQKDSLISVFKKLKNCNLNFRDLYSTFISNHNYENYLSNDNFPWFYIPFSDTIKFDRVDEIVPMCKYYENNTFTSIVFTDSYDYKSALHLINFDNKSFNPISSFILYSTGGDAEDFWDINVKKINALEFETIEEVGRFNDNFIGDTVFVEHQITKNIKIDSISGEIIKTKLSEKEDFIRIE